MLPFRGKPKEIKPMSKCITTCLFKTVAIILVVPALVLPVLVGLSKVAKPFLP